MAMLVIMVTNNANMQNRELKFENLNLGSVYLTTKQIIHDRLFHVGAPLQEQ